MPRGDGEEHLLGLFDVDGLEPFLRFLGSLAVLAGTVLVVAQLRVNARQAKSRNAFDLIAKVTDPSFPIRRHTLYEVAARYSDGDWTGFDRSLDDFEVRAFANFYEQLGLLVRKGVIELDDVMEAFSAQPMADWSVFAPVRRHIIDEAAVALPALSATATADALYWPNFGWLAAENSGWISRQLSALARRESTTGVA
jgi:glycine/D-amino acid oxidase-like deaminating enzyme